MELFTGELFSALSIVCSYDYGAYLFLNKNIL